MASGVSGDHDVLMILGDHREVVVDAEYTDPDRGHTRPCGRDQFPWEKTSDRTETPARLGSQAACQLVFTAGENAWGVIQAAGSDRGQGIIYTLLLTTTVKALWQDLASLREAAASFKRTSVVP